MNCGFQRLFWCLFVVKAATLAATPLYAQKSPPANTEGKSAAPPAYQILRYDEDYSYLKDPSRRTDCWDAIKYMPLGRSGLCYLSMGGESRERYEFYHNEDLGAAPADSRGNNGYLLQRYMLHGDLHLGQNVRFFGQFISGLEDGRIGGPRPDIDRNVFDFHQAFADFVLRGAEEHDSLTFRTGRQEMTYGSGRLIDVREGPNLRRSFDATRFLLRRGDWSVDGWWSKPVRNQPWVMDDNPDPQRSFWGFYGVRPLGCLPEGNVDLYYLGYENKNATYNQGTGYELRHSLGTRLWGKPMPWEYNFEYVWQFGIFGPGTISAWTAAHAIRYNFTDRPLKPRIGLRADVTSGDRNANSPNLQTFNPLFPSGVYFNLANPVGPLNMIDLHPVFDLYFGEKVTATLDWDFFWRESLNDGVYRLSGSLLRPAGGSSASYVGNAPSLTLVWNPTRHLSLLASYVHFFPGEFFRGNPPNGQLDYVTVWGAYKF